jgi:hypothetical protein
MVRDNVFGKFFDSRPSMACDNISGDIFGTRPSMVRGDVSGNIFGNIFVIPVIACFPCQMVAHGGRRPRRRLQYATLYGPQQRLR